VVVLVGDILVGRVHMSSITMSRVIRMIVLIFAVIMLIFG
jgi:hypothetical protein